MIIMSFLGFWCTIKIFGGEQWWWQPFYPLLPANDFCLYPPPVPRCFWKGSLMTPNTLPPQFSLFYCHLPLHPPSSPPPSNFSQTFPQTFRSIYHFKIVYQQVEKCSVTIFRNRASVKSAIPGIFFWVKWILSQRSKPKASRSILWISAMTKMTRIRHFRKLFNFNPILDYYRIRLRTNFENPNGKSSDLHLIMWFILRKLFWVKIDFTGAIFKIPQISKHFSAVLYQHGLFKRNMTKRVTSSDPLCSQVLEKGSVKKALWHLSGALDFNPTRSYFRFRYLK